MKSKFRLRFSYTGGGATHSITASEIQSMYLMAVTSTQGYRIWDSCRIKKVETWCAVDPTYGTPVSPSIEFPGNSGSGQTFSDTALGFSDVAYVSASPPVSSLAWDWLPTSSSSVVMELYTPTNSIVDIVLDVTFNEKETPQVVGIVSGVPGVIYMRCLDSTSGNTLIPNGYLNI